jgi:hypothetical protein
MATMTELSPDTTVNADDQHIGRDKSLQSGLLKLSEPRSIDHILDSNKTRLAVDPFLWTGKQLRLLGVEVNEDGRLAALNHRQTCKGCARRGEINPAIVLLTRRSNRPRDWKSLVFGSLRSIQGCRNGDTMRLSRLAQKTPIPLYFDGKRVVRFIFPVTARHPSASDDRILVAFHHGPGCRREQLVNRRGETFRQAFLQSERENWAGMDPGHFALLLALAQHNVMCLRSRSSSQCGEAQKEQKAEAIRSRLLVTSRSQGVLDFLEAEFPLSFLLGFHDPTKKLMHGVRVFKTRVPLSEPERALELLGYAVDLHESVSSLAVKDDGNAKERCEGKRKRSCDVYDSPRKVARV